MKALRLAALLVLAPLLAVAQELETNVNERYTVESVEVTGVDQTGFSRSLRERIHALAGQKFSQQRLDELSHLINKALPGRSVSVRIRRGRMPDYIKVVIEVRSREQIFDLAAPKAAYTSGQGWTGEVDATLQSHSNGVTFGLLSDGDTLAERFTGLRARYENRQIGDGRVRLAVEFGDYHEAWNPATQQAAGSTGLYRARQEIEPVATVVLARPLKLSVGFSFERLEPQVPAAHSEASGAVITTLRYDRLVEDSGLNLHRVEAGYNLRAATSSLAGDFDYTRHTFDFRYTFWRGAHRISSGITAGFIRGAAPLFERFVLGTSTTLRGWNKYALAPLGGSRVVYSSVEYRYRFVEAFYDNGAVWSAGERAVLRHSAGAGIRIGDLALLLAFPLRHGRPEPVFIAGLNL
jgi:outer membrane protein assembly factor BamA